MWDPANRVIAHIDMDAFYASVEKLDNPELEGKPVIVGGTSRRGVVSAASYEARRFGIHSAMPMFQAKKRCPHGVFLPVRMRRYVDVSRTVMAQLRDFSPLVEQVGVDEAYIDLTGTQKLFGTPEESAWRIKKRIVEASALTCSIGISISKLLAKIASDMNKPDGLTVVSPADVDSFLSVLPIGKVPGIGKKSENELRKIGVTYVGDIKTYSADWLRERFGTFGDRLSLIASGDTGSRVVPYEAPKSISAEETLADDTRDPAVLKRYMLGQAERVGRSLRKKGFSGRTVTIKIKHADFRQVTRRATLDGATHSAKVIYGEAVKLLAAYPLESDVRLVGVGVSGLEPAGRRSQLGLFEETAVADKKWERAEAAMDEIVKRFGHGAVKRGTLLED
jgi:DNA polymerase-4